MPHVLIQRIQDGQFDSHRVCHQGLPRAGSPGSYSAAIENPCVEQLSIVNMGIRAEVVPSSAQTRANFSKVRSVSVECACPLSVVIPGFKANQLQSSPHALSEVFYRRSEYRTAVPPPFCVRPVDAIGKLTWPARLIVPDVGFFTSGAFRPISPGAQRNEILVSRWIGCGQAPDSCNRIARLGTAWEPLIFVMPTIRFEMLYVFLVLAHNRRQIVHFAVTAHPTTECKVQQLREAFSRDCVPRYLQRDRDRIFGKGFVDQVKAMRSNRCCRHRDLPWHRAYVERLVGSILRECLDRMIVFNERSLHQTLTSFSPYYHNSRTHLSLGKDTPHCRRTQNRDEGTVVEIRVVGELHRHYERRVA